MPYFPDLLSMRLCLSLWLGPPNSTSLPVVHDALHDGVASLSSAKSVPYLDDVAASFETRI